jgi:adenine deaminase
VRAIECTTALVTAETEVELPLVDGRVIPDPAADVLKVAAFDRVLRSEARFVGFIKGFGLRAGAVASTMTWDSQCMLAIGANDRDLALAACRMYDIQGGAAVFRDGELLAELEAPLAGFQSRAPLPEVAAALTGVGAALHELGCPWPHPLLTLNVLTTAAIPFFRITDHGYVRLRTGERVGLFLD